MVRNSCGGSKTKSFARKNILQPSAIVDYVPTNELEQIAVVSKLFGNNMCQVITVIGNQTLVCHIRGKFRGRTKKQNTVTLNSRIVVGLREWENPPKNCDLISVLNSYEDTSSNIGGSSKANNTLDNFTFSNEDVDDIMPSTKTNSEPSNMIGYDLDDLDIDDI